MAFGSIEQRSDGSCEGYPGEYGVRSVEHCERRGSQALIAAASSRRSATWHNENGAAHDDYDFGPNVTTAVVMEEKSRQRSRRRERAGFVA